MIFGIIVNTNEVEIIPYIDYWAPIAPLPKDGE